MRYRTKEFIVATEYKPKVGKLYYVGADGNIYETTMGPKSKGYKAPMVVELNLKREKGWLYFFKRNPKQTQNNSEAYHSRHPVPPRMHDLLSVIVSGGQLRRYPPNFHSKQLRQPLHAVLAGKIEK